MDLKFVPEVMANLGNNEIAAPLDTNSLIVFNCDVHNKISGENPALAERCRMAKF